MSMEKVTFVLTCCGRVDLLERTLDTFFEHNDYPIERFIITEDSADEEVFEQCRKLNKEKYNNKLEFVFNHDKLGQSASIDKAYSMVDTEYIFHCEEDWEFYRGGFIQDSIKVLKTQPKVLQAWIRPKSDKILNKIEQKRYTLPGGVRVRRVLPVSFKVKGANEDGTDMIIRNYMGFSWNPGLKRKKDWELLEGGYSFFEREHLVDHHYRDLGYMIVSLSDDDSDGYVRHIGWGRRAANPVYRKDEIKAKKVKVLGDSHAQAFDFYTGSDFIFDVTVVHGATARGAINPNTKTNALNIFKDNLGKGKCEKIIVCLGEVDCGYLVWYKNKFEGLDVLGQMHESVARLKKFIKQEVEQHYQPEQIYLLAAIPPTIEDNADKRFLAGARSKIDASIKERLDLTIKYNQQLSLISSENGWNMIDPTSQILNEDGRIKKEYKHPDEWNHHLNPPAHLKSILKYFK